MIPTFLVEKYIRLCGFDQLTKQNGKWNFRCAVCGDSKKDKRKKRAFILYDQMKYTFPLYSCHNCGYSKKFSTYLRDFKSHLYTEYKKEIISNQLFSGPLKLDEELPSNPEPIKILVDKETIFKGLNSAQNSAIALDYCIKRKLPQPFINELFYTKNFLKFVHDLNIKKFEKLPDSDERLVIPIYSQSKELTHIQGRALYDCSNKYITISIIENRFKIWGLDRIKLGTTIYCFEGVFDAVFIPNSLAVLGGQFDVKELRQYANVYCPDTDIHKNFDIRKKCLEWIKAGGKLFIPPVGLAAKDINDMIMNDVKVEQILTMIRENTFSGIQAMVRLKAMGE